MIPLRLILRNFLSYGENLQTVDFSTYSLICLSGKNGHGKSALLDAMTWALWGQARKISGTAKADAGLLRLGATRMLVSFEFIFNNRRYRVRREYAQTYGKPYACLDFEVFDEKSESYVSLTDKTIRQTQHKIEQLIGLDFDTFVNSAFLRQGQSNEFSKKSSRERKQILASILGVSLYDSLQAKSSEKSRELIDKKKILQAVNEQIATDLLKLSDIKQEFEICTKEQAAVIQTLQALDQQAAFLENKRACLLAQKGEYQQLLLRIEENQKKQEEQVCYLKDLIALWKKVHIRSLYAHVVERLMNERKILIHQESDLRAIGYKAFVVQGELFKVKDEYHKRLALVKSEEEKKTYEQKLTVQKVEMMSLQLLAHINQKEKRLQEFRQQADQKEAERARVNQLLKEQQQFEKIYGKTRTQFDKRRTYHQVLISRGQLIDQQLAEIAQKRLVLCDQQTPSCPTCEQVLTLKRRTFLVDKFTDQEKLYLQRRRRIALVVKKLKHLLLEQHKEIELLEQQKGTFVQGAILFKELEGAVKDIGGQAELLYHEITALTLQKKELDVQLDALKVQATFEKKDTFLKDELLISLNEKINALQAEQEALKYDKQKHDGVLESIKQIEGQLVEWDELKRLLAEQGQRRLSISQAIQRLKEIRSYHKDLLSQVEKYARLSSEEDELGKEAEILHVHRVQAQTAREKLLQQLGRVESEKFRLEGLAKEAEKRDAEIKFLNAEIENYQTLAQAFSKDGIQALIIEDAIPEIENEANILLSRLTDNQSQIFIESLRDLKKGGVRETLDIQISDAAGVRPYEMFSGGEAFRIDFALRIAISKLLARRAGTALQSLIIDEGFGSQDDEGLGRLMDALYAVQSDFSKIIVVSHLPSMKDNFPVHLVVEKGADGSVVTIHERG